MVGGCGSKINKAGGRHQNTLPAPDNPILLSHPGLSHREPPPPVSRGNPPLVWQTPSLISLLCSFATLDKHSTQYRLPWNWVGYAFRLYIPFHLISLFDKARLFLSHSISLFDKDRFFLSHSNPAELRNNLALLVLHCSHTTFVSVIVIKR